MKINLQEIANMVGGEAKGDKDVELYGVATIDRVKEGEITFAVSLSTFKAAVESKATALFVSKEYFPCNKNLIIVNNPRLAFAKVLRLFYPSFIKPPAGVHSTAIIGQGVNLGEGITIHPWVVVEENVKIGKNVVIYPFVYIGKNCIIGDETVIYPNVTIREDVVIGARCIVHSGVVLGSDGFGFEWDGEKHYKIIQVGKVVIEDDVEIGAGVTIDRATMGETRVGRGTKIDNLVHLGHNVTVGENCIIVAQVGLAGSVKIGNQVLIGGQVGIAQGIKVGDKARIAAKSGVISDIDGGAVILGYPAMEHYQFLKINSLLRKLPELFKDVKKLKEKFSN